MRAIEFHLTQQENVPVRLARITNHQIKALTGQIATADGNREEVTHDVRRTIKQLRSIWRLLRPVIGERKYQQNNISLRDTGHKLSATRDLVVAGDTLKNLITQSDDRDIREALTTVLEGVIKQEVKAEQPAQQQQAELNRAARTLTENAKHFQKLWLPEKRWRAIEPGLKRSYRAARKRMSAAATALKKERGKVSEAFHDWRKVVKYLWFQTQLIEPIWPDHLAKLAKQLKKLESTLGDDHDLTILQQRLRKQPELFGGQPVITVVDHYLRQQQDQLRRSALALADDLFDDKPKQFINKLAKHWQEWQK